MLDKKTVKNILLEVEAANYNYEKYLQSIINMLCNDSDNDTKYIIEREKNYNYLCLYKYSKIGYIEWLYDECSIIDEDINDLINNYELIREYVQQNYTDYFVEENILNFINIKKFKKELYNNKSLLQQVINDLYTNIRNYVDNEYLVNEYKLNKYLYNELLKIKKL